MNNFSALRLLKGVNAEQSAFWLGAGAILFLAGLITILVIRHNTHTPRYRRSSK